MQIEARRAEYREIQKMRDIYREEMDCQIIHDSIHTRPGWTVEYLMTAGEATAGYGSVAAGGPWKDQPSVYEFYVLPQFRTRMFDLFSALLASSGAGRIETQSNDALLTVMLHAFAREVTSESILFHDRVTTALAPPGATFRPLTPADVPEVFPEQVDSHGVVEFEGKVAGKGGILFHYNRPYGDIFMETAEPFRRRGLGSFLVQELKRLCYAQGSVPAARCNTGNLASRKTLQKAGFVPCGHILVGELEVGG